MNTLSSIISVDDDEEEEGSCIDQCLIDSDMLLVFAEYIC